MASPSPLATKGERLGEALDLIYDEYEQALALQDRLIAKFPEEGEVIEELKLRLNFEQARSLAERVDFAQDEPSNAEVDAVFNFGTCVTTVLEYCKSTSAELRK